MIEIFERILKRLQDDGVIVAYVVAGANGAPYIEFSTKSGAVGSVQLIWYMLEASR